MIINLFNQIIDNWINALAQYSFTQLCTKPSLNSWSLGQLYVHIIDQTDYYIGQIKICISNNTNTDGEESAAAKKMFLDNSFPDLIIEGPPENAYVEQASDKEELLNRLKSLKEEANIIESLISKTPFRGKTKHPGLNYFGANEWLQFAEMHLRHHLRQKKRIDEFLKVR